MEAERIATEVRKILLEEVIIPYNLHLGRSKRNDSLLGYGDLALRRFTKWLNQNTALSQIQHQLALYVFKTLIKILDEIREGSKSVWQDSKLVWIPLHYGLKPLEYNSQAEMDAVLEKVTGDEFVNGNDVHYVINEQFQPEVARMILEAEDYHVLWIHDYRGQTPAKNPDRIGFAQTLFGYLSAMTNRVQTYDDTGKFPAYIILIDQFYYEANKGQWWLSLLQNPLKHELKLPTDYKQWESQIREAQHNLKIAAAQSSRLQQQAAKFGQDWLANNIKVHVNVTNPSDFSFRSAHLIDNMPITPDNLTRDHRKVSFYDVTEEDPGKGEAIYSGLGIGEHYSGPTWEDRSLLVRGPVLVSLKDAVRQVLMQQGFKENEIPPPLRKLPRPENYAEMVKTLTAKGWEARVMDIHNQTGFYPKPLNALKAALYSLMPPGATIMVPDSLWNSPFWGGMLAGAALRGCRVLVLAPALANAPSAGFPQMSRAHELFMRLVIVQNELRDEIAGAGGMLKVGKYTRSSDVGDLPAKLKEFAEGVRQNPFIKDIFPFRPEVYSLVETFDPEQAIAGFKPTYYAQDVEKRKPKLHLKTNFFASKEMQKFLAWEGWDDVLRYYLQYRAALTAREEIYVDVRDVPEELEEAASMLIDSYWDALPEDEKQQVMYYLMVGSQNQDYRGMIMDGEVAAVVSGEYSLVGLIDLFFMTGLTTWVDDIRKLDDLLPPESGWRRWLGRYIMKAL